MLNRTLIVFIPLVATSAGSARAEPRAGGKPPSVEAAAGPTSAPAHAPKSPLAGPARGQAQVLFTTDIYGRFAWPGCAKRARDHAELSHLITAVRQVGLQSGMSGKAVGGRPLVLHAGSMIRLDVMGTYLFSADEKVGREATGLLRRVGFDAVAAGLFDFGAPRAAMMNYARLMKSQRIPLLAGNVRCTRQDDKRCALLGGAPGQRFAVFERGGLRIGVFGVVRADMLKRILARSGNGVIVEDPVTFSLPIVRHLREVEQVDVVVALANLNLESDAPWEVLQYARALGARAPELIITNSMYERHGNTFLRELRTGNSVIVGTDRFGQHLGQAVLHYRREAGRAKLVKIDVEHYQVDRFSPDPSASKTLDSLMARMCAALDRPLGKARLSQPMRYQDFMRYTMEIMRRQVGAEVAILNESSTADTSFPMSGSITREKLLRAIRTDTTIGWVKLLGSRLIELLGAYANSERSGLNVLGMQYRGDEWLVNGRPIIEGQRYRVALTAFVANGGDQLILLDPTEHYHDRPQGLRDSLIAFFGNNKQGEDGDPTVDLDADFSDLRDRWLLYTAIDLGIAFSNVVVSNGDDGNRYALPVLNRDEVTNLALDIQLSFGGSNRDHALEGDLQLQYGGFWSAKDDGFSESLDRITATSIYKLHMIRNSFGYSKWYIPEPYAEGRLTSEFTASVAPPEGTVGDKGHYVDLAGGIGLGWTLFPLLFAKVGAVVKGQVSPTSGSDEAAARAGFYLGYLLRRIKFFASTDHPVELESRLDYYVTDLADELKQELSWQSKLLFALTQRLHLTATHRLYAFDSADNENDRPLSIANDISLGLALSFDFRRQTF